MEQAEPEMYEDVVAKDLAVLKDIEIPLLELIHDLKDVGPLACVHIDYLTESLLVFLDLVLIRLGVLSVQLLQEVV